MLKTLVAKPYSNIQRALAVMAEHCDVLLGVEFLVHAGGDVAHRHVDAGFNVGRCVFPRFANIKETGFVFAKECRRIDWGDFKIDHAKSLREDLTLRLSRSLARLKFGDLISPSRQRTS